MKLKPKALVYCDIGMTCERNRMWHYTYVHHMFVAPGHIELLHEVAAIIGLRRAWFQPKKYLPHYDLTISKFRQFKTLAKTRNDLVVANWRDVARITKHWRQENA